MCVCVCVVSALPLFIGDGWLGSLDSAGRLEGEGPAAIGPDDVGCRDAAVSLGGSGADALVPRLSHTSDVSALSGPLSAGAAVLPSFALFAEAVVAAAGSSRCAGWALQLDVAPVWPCAVMIRG